MRKSTFLISIVWIILLQACASQKPPTGGPKDLDPPVVTISIPKNQSTQFRGRQLRLVFDEIIDVKNLKGELIISPNPDFQYKEKIRSKSLIINLIDTLEKNTTYTFNFGSAISDITEKNVPDNLVLAFSTGNVLDTGIIRGRVLNIENHQPAKKDVIVGLYHPSDTLDPRKHKPIYYTKAEDDGTFFIGNLPIKEFKLFAFTDKNLNKLFDIAQEKIAFQNTNIFPDQDSTETVLYLVKQDFTKPKLIRTFPGADYFRMSFSKGISAFSLQENNTSHRFGNENKEVFLFPQNADSVQFSFSMTDSLGNRQDSTATMFLSPEGKPYDGSKELVSQPKKGAAILKGDSIIFDSSFPLRSLNSDSIIFYQNDDTLNFSDYFDQKPSLPWVFKPELKLQKFGFLFKKGSAITILGDTLGKNQMIFSFQNPENYGQMEGSVKTTEQCYIVEVVDPSFLLIRSLINPEDFAFKGLDPGKYRIRVMIDKNCNERWDIGDFRNSREPEFYHFYEEEIQLKANWIQQDKVVEF